MKLTTILLVATALLWASHVPAFGQIANITPGRQGIAYAAASKTVTTTYTATKEDHTLLANATSAAFTISLPPVSTKAYPYLIIKKTDSTTNAVTIDAYGSQTIDGATTVTLGVQYARIVLHADGSEWRVITSEPVLDLTENVTATNAITAAESGETFFLNSATEFVSTLPAPAAGLRYTFIVVAAPSLASYTVVTTNSANVIKGMQVCAADAAGDTGTADDTITFVDGQAVAGDMVTVWSDGTSWFAVGHSRVAAGLTFTQFN
jgi:hypothetical protein